MCGPAVRSLVVLFASFASSFLTNVRYFPFIDFGVEEGPSSGRTVRLYLAGLAAVFFAAGSIQLVIGHYRLATGKGKME
jgi:hypothetical protein